MNIQGYGAVIQATPGAKGERAPSFDGGSVIKAEVTAQKGPLLTLRGADGSFFTALMQSERTVTPGQILLLKVAGESDGVPVVEITESHSVNLRAALMSFGAEPDAQNIAIAREMLRGGLDLTLGNFSALKSAMAENPGLDAARAVFMAKHSIPATAENIRLMERLTRPESQLGGLISKLIAALSDAESAESPVRPQALGDAGAARGAPDTGAQVPSGSPSLQQTPGSAPAAGGGVPIPPDIGADANIAAAGKGTRYPAAPLPGASEEPGEGARLPNDPQQPAPAGHSPAARAERASAGQAGRLPAVSEFPADGGKPFSEVQSDQSGLRPGPPAARPSEISTVQVWQSPSPAGGRDATDAAQLLTGEGDTAYSSPPREAAQIGGALPSMRDTALTPPEKSISGDGVAPTAHAPARAASPEAASAAPQRAAATPASGLIGELDALFRGISAERRTARVIDVPRLAREIGALIEKTELHARSLPPGKAEPVREAAREIMRAVRFSEHMQSFASYAQIPVRIGDERTTASLYVFNDSREKKGIDPQNATMFLSLGTANLGRVEGFVKIVGRQVEADFSAESGRSAALLRSHMKELSDALEAAGFRLVRAGTSAGEKPSAPEDVGQAREAAAARYSFDMKV